MQYPRVVSDLLQVPGKRFRELAARLEERAAVIAEVHRILPRKLAAHVASAGIEHGRLTIGVTGAVWASRLRYLTAQLRKDVGAALQTEIVSVRIRIVPPTADCKPL